VPSKVVVFGCLDMFLDVKDTCLWVAKSQRHVSGQPLGLVIHLESKLNDGKIEKICGENFPIST
jgi:hypothetical protein